MPNIVHGNMSAELQNIYRDVKYDYANGIDLSPNSKLHKKIIDLVVRMSDDSYAQMSKRHSTWNDIDNTLKVYIPADDAEKQIKSKDKRRPTSIVVPYSYATIETIMAYLTKGLLSDNVFQYDGQAPEDTLPAKMLELVVNQQVRRFKSDLEMHTSLRDSLAYGFGASTVAWSEVWGKRTVLEEIPMYGMFGGAGQSAKTKVNKDALLFEGNEVIAIDPYKFLPDPNVSIHNIQAGDFVGWIEFQSFNRLLSDESSGNGYVNVKHLRTQQFVNITSKYSTDASKRISKKEPQNTDTSAKRNYITSIHMYVRLIPKEWGLPGSDGNSGGDMPEIWLFTIANEQLVLRAMPLGLNHNRYPVAIAAPDYDGYSITPLSRMELIDGLQTTLNWMFNSHIANVRKSINDMLIVDPSLVNMEDLANPEPGKLIRLRRSAWGRGVNGAVEQLRVNDITARNMQDAEQIMALMQRASAATDATMGIQRSGGDRVTASEYSGTMQMAVSRLEHIAKIISKQYMVDLAYFHASHTQQLMSQEIYAKASGEWPDRLMQEFGLDAAQAVPISPFDILADFDIIYRDGTTATADALSNEFWSRNFMAILQSDKLGSFDIQRIFMHMARLNGAKNSADFIVKEQVPNASLVQDQEVLAGAKAGNLVPLDELESLGGYLGGDES